MSNIIIEHTNEMPNKFRNGIWEDLYAVTEKMQIDDIIKVTCENKAEVRSAQSSLQAGNSTRATKKLGFKYMTRTSPVNGNKDGKWFLYIKRIA